MRFLFLLIVGWALLAGGCAPAKRPGPALLRAVTQIRADGTMGAVPDGELSAFTKYVRSRLPRPPAQQVVRLFMLEVDVPEGTGLEGAYLVVAIFADGKGVKGGAQFDYFEQWGHAVRRDRYFHRRLSEEEMAEFLAHVDADPVAGVLAGAKGAATQQEAVRGAIVFRYTEADLKGARTLVIDSPAKEDAAAVALIGQFSKLRDAAATPPLTCTYVLSIPMNARIEFADPQRKVLNVWHGQAADGSAELRVEIFPPLDFSFDQVTAESATPGAKWYVRRAGTWEASETSPELVPPATMGAETQAQTQAASGPATGPATTQLAASQPSRFSDPGILPLKEIWHCEPGTAYTNVWHYIPIDRDQGQWLGFVVPGLTFDEKHMQVDMRGRVLYVVHDGHLISLPIPDAVLRVR